MALTCARCGAQNPDGNLYCQACGTPLAAPAGVTSGAFPGPPPGPPPGMAPPSPSYTSPYYAPAAASVPVHRTPWTLIVAAVVALVVLVGGFSTAFAILKNGGSPATSAGSIGDVASPTPGLNSTPVASPTSTSTGSQTASNDGLSLDLPSGWVVDSKDNETIVLTDPGSEGSVTVSSGVSIPTQNAQQNKDTIVSALRSKYPDTRDCPNSKTTTTTLNGVSGISWTLCFTLTSGANSVPAAASLFAGANSGGTVYYLVMVLTTQDNLANYLNVTRPVVQSVRWKLS